MSLQELWIIIITTPIHDLVLQTLGLIVVTFWALYILVYVIDKTFKMCDWIVDKTDAFKRKYSIKKEKDNHEA